MAISGRIPSTEPLASIDADGDSAYAVMTDLADQGERRYDPRADVEREVLTLYYRPQAREED